ncbi:MAG: hypothetical protein A3E84_03780 [Gammaproteobacteria bacterium RIFCSPHIGHO2_12_FULL_42_13]|nr:MAG: hypothetical protein A3E84_03780 [Gammaproteobacteria bacterium RIFCSPHIGHO2_12_FULL_42_13]
MRVYSKLFHCLFLIYLTLFSYPVLAAQLINIPILCYHNLNPSVPGSMTMTPQRFESEMKWLKDNGFTIVPLKEAVAYLQGKRASLPSKSIVVTVDDGWKSVYTYMQPILRKYNIPVTLFIFPQTISTGKNSLTWDQLRELQQTGLFDIESHTYSHPNFKQAKKRLSPESYKSYVMKELVNAKKMLDEKLGINTRYLAWPFGIYNEYLESAAAEAGYSMAFTIDYRSANKSFRPLAQPRFMILESQSMKTFQSLVNQATVK